MPYAENRAQMYWWLSSLAARELDATQLSALFSDNMHQFMTALSEDSDLKESAEQLINAVNKLRLRTDYQLELAADYASLFLGAGRSSVQPYASVYLSDDGLLMQEPHQQMIALLAKYGFAQSEEFKEPADHIAIILDLLGNLVVKEVSEAEQLECLNTHLLSWIPDWSKEVVRFDSFGFYGALSQLILAFCRQETEFLSA